MSKKLSSKGKKLPKFKSDEEMAHFVETTDMSNYINSKNFVPASKIFEFESKDKTLTMRLPARLLDAVKVLAAKKHMPYQRLIRAALQNLVGETSR